ncbi:hypothetical protein Sango_0158200 [Sesamum angolense]|uniref:Uncharacterized protein n=1 Tax=Sesamum angolense TaxID=2727404 RepID=A0AAE2C6F8_9LAMI|nr:hypothetical protein Sango_0158200 [Sesamum angolense]
MATSAFKSTSRRATAAEHNPPPPAAASRRRSHSVSAVSRKTHLPFDDNTLISTEFSNSRDNPLFWATSSSSPDKEESGKISEIASKGRSATRSSGDKNGIGRSLSRVRGRSVSRAPCKGAYEDGKEQEVVTSTVARNRNEIKKIDNGVKRTNSVRSRSAIRGCRNNAGTTVTQIQATEWSEDDSAYSLQISNLEDGISIGSLSEAEEKTIKAVCEDLKVRSVCTLNIYGYFFNGEERGGDMPPGEIYASVRSEVRRAISDIQNDLESACQRNNANIVAATSVAVMPSGVVNPEPVELISDIRREYAMKLEESEERARKLRADLAVEEHRGQELDRILKEILLEPKTSDIQRSRRGRRTSNERKRMSKRLTDEAMAYFDECVSLSTFDSSDFSASEDPPYSSVGGAVYAGASSLVRAGPSTSCCYDQGSDLHHKQTTLCFMVHTFPMNDETIFGGQVQFYSCDDSGPTANSSSTEPGSTQLYQFSFADKKSENVGPKEDIRNYIRNFERGPKKDLDFEETLSYYDAGEYSAHGHRESVLIDRVLYSSRIESGV